jgi:hypothetical protein
MRLIIALVILVALIGALAPKNISPMTATTVATSVPMRRWIPTVVPDPCQVQLNSAVKDFLNGTNNKSEVLKAASDCADKTLEPKVQFAMDMNDTIFLKRLISH